MALRNLRKIVAVSGFLAVAGPVSAQRNEILVSSKGYAVTGGT